MQIGETIRKYRKNKDMTQEEMAKRLGVTAPAVNKWEKGNSYPDITLLGPIARLLDISLDTLLSFQKELTAEEINGIVCELDAMLKEKPYEEAFLWAKKKLEEYPDCEPLIWQLAVILDAQCSIQKLPESDNYEEYVYSLYVRVLESESEEMRSHAADSLFAFYMRKKQYDKAEECLNYFSEQNPERKRKLAELYGETNRIQEAYKAYEELLFEQHNMMGFILYGMYSLAVRNQDRERAHMIVEKQEEMARFFEMGKYHEISNRLDLATLEKDDETVVQIMEELLSNVDSIYDFRKSPLYEHMELKEVREEFVAGIKKNLQDCFRDEESWGFLKENKRWQELVHTFPT